MRGLLLDLDDTLFDHAPAERQARQKMLGLVASDVGQPVDAVAALYDASRLAVKKRVGHTGPSHSRLLYLLELAHRARGPLGRVRAWERTFWAEYTSTAKLRPYAREFLSGFRSAGNKIAIVTDLIVETQLWKLETFGLFDSIDALVVSEEVAADKPARFAFDLAAERLGLPLSSCVVVGDSNERDGGGARSLGIPYYRAVSSDPAARSDDGPVPMDLFAIAAALGVHL